VAAKSNLEANKSLSSKRIVVQTELARVGWNEHPSAELDTLSARESGSRTGQQ
jgi:hypothetical protein